KAPKPLPACATPVAEGMKVFTRSARAISAQRSVMEFLLINHPLDCPICDQGGECELQDLAMGFGRDVSRYTEKKRVVRDQDIGPLVSTDMTRCIHCTRCVRFGEEIAGIQELGTTGRTEDMRIETFVGRTVDHELSGNIIDLCPVGALNNKPYRYSARAWEMLEHPAVAPHDCAGSNIFVHTLRGEVKRVVPRRNEAVNETWISDRDRFSCHGIYSEDRLQRPLVREDGEWCEADWQVALERAAAGLRSARERDGAAALGALAAPGSTLEEFYLLQRLLRGIGSDNVDHRLRRVDFRDQEHDPVFPWLGMSIAGLERLNAALVIGSNLRKEAPILAHRLRKAAMRDAAVMFVNPQPYEHLFPVAATRSVSPADLIGELTSMLAAAARLTGRAIPAALRAGVEGAGRHETAEAMVRRLIEAQRGVVLLGHVAQRLCDFADIRAVAAALAALCDTALGYVADGGNAVGAHLAGALPHRGPGGRPVAEPGRTAADMLSAPPAAMLLLGLEPELDCAQGSAALEAVEAAGFVVVLSPWATAEMRRYADVILPVGTFVETSGTYVNCEGRWQSFGGVARAVGQSRPAWKVLRVLGNLLGLDGFDYRSSADVRNELAHDIESVQPDNRFESPRPVAPARGRPVDGAGLEVPIYAVDGLVRRSAPLQMTRDARAARGEADPLAAAGT
ncbi:MAG TPA: NADH-quinone oxidoreductase subunit NuoG, partial [Gammaproteobacteria bacterium]|nr:NADH-quinone oxidoreductase subunit NuoG [Gammaproteobacteria bacterium]